MIKFSRHRLPACALALAAALAPGAALAAEAKIASGYQWPVGTQVTYQTHLSAEVRTGEQVSSRTVDFTSRYTVLEESNGDRTVFAAIDAPREADEASPTSAPATQAVARFTFQLQRDGSIGERLAGMPAQPLDFWSTDQHFPPLIIADGTTAPVAVPPLSFAPIVQTKISNLNNTKKVDYAYDPKASANEPPGPRIREATGSFEFDTKQGVIKQGSYKGTIAAMNPMGVSTQIEIAARISLGGVEKLAEAKLPALRKDVAAGVQTFEKFGAAVQMAQQDGATSNILSVFETYSKEFPAGEFAPLYAEMTRSVKAALEVAERKKQVAVGRAADPLKRPSLDGKKIDLADYKGKVVLIDFWATWCGPCRQMVPELQELLSTYKSKGFEIIGISADQQESTLRDYLKENNIGWPQIFDPPAAPDSLHMKYGIDHWPTPIVVGRDGKIVSMDERGEALKQTIEQALTVK